MPKYVLLIVESERAYEEAGEAEFNKVMQDHGDFTREVDELGGKILGGEALLPVATATFLRGTRTDDVTTFDNPAPDLKEIVGGYYVIEADDEAHARRIGGRCPAEYGYIVVRPVWEIPDTNAG